MPNLLNLNEGGILCVLKSVLSPEFTLGLIIPPSRYQRTISSAGMRVSYLLNSSEIRETRSMWPRFYIRFLLNKVKISKKTSLRNLDHWDFLRGPYENESHHSLNKSYDRINDLMRTSTRETKNVFKSSQTMLSLNTGKDDASQLYRLWAGSVTIFPEANHERASVRTPLVADNK